MTVTEIINNELLYMCIVVLLITSQGFIRTIFFITSGYGFSVSALSLTILVFFVSKNSSYMSPVFLFQTLFLLIYGLRLSIFLLMRESNKKYKNAVKHREQESSISSFGKKVFIWIGVTGLYILMMLPLYNRAIHESLLYSEKYMVFGFFGICLMAAGLIMESLADFQKSRFKKTNPDLFCHTRLFDVVRYPNYLGEILFWTGNFLTSLLIYGHILLAMGALIGYIAIVLIMLNSTRMLEAKQNQRYGHLKKYQYYCSQVPILIPFTRIYTFQKKNK